MFGPHINVSSVLFSAKNLEATIIHDLLDGYDPRAFPLDDDKSIVVNVSYFLMQLQGLVSNFSLKFEEC